MIKIISVFLILLAGALNLSSQSGHDAEILLADSYGESILLDLDNNAVPMVFVVYGPGCGVCIKELSAISKKAVCRTKTNKAAYHKKNPALI